MSADTVLVLIGDVAAGVAAVAAVIALRFARQTVRDARTERREVQVEQFYRRVERVGEIVEDLYGKVSLIGTDRWAADRNRLGHALVGLTARFPACAAYWGPCPRRTRKQCSASALAGTR